MADVEYNQKVSPQGWSPLSERWWMNCHLLRVVVRRDLEAKYKALNLWFNSTPIVYPAPVIPEGWQDWVFGVKPLAEIAEVYRDLILVGEVLHQGE